MTFDQGEFNFDKTNQSDGYKNWQKELKELQHQWELHWGIILGKKVRVYRREYTQALEGIMSIIEPLPKRNKPPTVRIGHHTFKANEIESISIISEN